MEARHQASVHSHGDITQGIGAQDSLISFRAWLIALGLTVLLTFLASGQVLAAVYNSQEYSDDDLAILKAADTDPTSQLDWAETTAYGVMTGVHWTKRSDNKFHVIDIDLSYKSISGTFNLISLPFLESVNLSGEIFTTLNLSNNEALKTINIRGNSQLTTLDISGDTALKSLTLTANALSSLDTSDNIALDWLEIDQNNLSSVDFANNINLRHLVLDSNELTDLDTSQNNLLIHIYANNNRLTSINIHNNTFLTD
ncbi:MAG: hypothetical protein LBS60_02495 [Deltaproteobacteria bacterium]|jgi:hypothetical protein|nr:hypothetical protein [Deltaproteobacteria bacterium]